MQCLNCNLILLILFNFLISANSCLPIEEEKQTTNPAAANLHPVTKRSNDNNYIQYYAIQPRAGKQYPPYYTTLRCQQYYRKPGKRPQCLEDLTNKTIKDNNNSIDSSHIDHEVSNKLDEPSTMQPLTTVPGVVRVPVQTFDNVQPQWKKAFSKRPQQPHYNSRPYQPKRFDIDARVAEVADILVKAPRMVATSMLDLIFGPFKQRRRIQDQIAATYLKHYGESD